MTRPPEISTTSSARSNDPFLMGNDDHRCGAPAVDLLEGLGQAAKAPEVNAGLRLVKDHQLRIAGQNGGDLNTLKLAAGETGIHIPVDILLTAQAHLSQIVAGILPG